MSRADANIVQARLAIEYLDTIGKPMHANAIRGVIKSLSTARATMSTLHTDNMALRDRLKQAEMEAASR